MNAPTIELVDREQLRPYDRNARTHTPKQVAQIAESITEFGWTNPILVRDDMTIIAGHGRWQAAKKLGQDKVPIIRLGHLTEEQARAYVIADNRLAESAGWDDAILASELQALVDLGFDIAKTGFSGAELNALLTDVKAGEVDADSVPEPVVDPISKLGDLWILGEHRIICGDSTDKVAVGLVLAGDAPTLMVTDPPYGVEYDPSWRDSSGLNKAHQKRANGTVLNDDRADWTETWNLFTGNAAYVWHGGLHSSTVEVSLAAAGFKCRAQIIWAKPTLVIGRGDYHWQHEPCWYAVREGKPGGYVGDRKQTTLWEIENMHATQGNVDDGKTNHGTQKPVECMRRPILNSSLPGAIIYEPFSGSGTTIIAAEMTGRKCRAVELNPVYVDMAVQRWEKFTGKKAERG